MVQEEGGRRNCTNLAKLQLTQYPLQLAAHIGSEAD